MDRNIAKQIITVSVIIPAYNAEMYIRECLDSLVNQTTQPDEVIVVDDGSTDDTATIVTEYAETHPFIKYIYQENQGQGKARNMALELAESTHVMFLDSDDYIHNQTIERCASWVAKEDPDLVHFEHRKLFESGAISYPKENRFFDGISVALDETCEMILNNSTYYTCNNMYRRGFLIDNDIRYGIGVSVQDYVFLAKVGIFAKKICFIHAPLYTYRIHNESTSHKNRDSRIQFESFLTGTIECLQAVNETNASDRATAFIINHKIRAYIHMYYDKTPRKYRKEFLTCLYDCFLPYNYQNLQLLSKGAKQFIGEGSRLTRKKYLHLLRYTQLNGLRRRLRKYSWLRKLYRRLKLIVRGIKRGLRNLKLKIKRIVTLWYEKSYSSQPILEKTMAIIGFNGEWKGNGKYLYQMLRNSFSDWRIVFLHSKNAKIPSDVDAVLMNSLNGRSLVFRSKVLFIESWASFPKRDDRIVIQLWHGTPIKQMLFDSAEPYIMKKSINHRSSQYMQIRKWDYFLCDSLKARDYFRSCFLLEDDRMLTSGYPRVKYLFDNHNNLGLKKKLRATLDVKENEKLIVYLPTWRDYASGGSSNDESIFLNQTALFEHLNGSEPFKLYSSMHRYNSKTTKETLNNFETQELILASDWIVSDYSSVIFDAIAINTPVALLTKDQERFEKARGLYNDIIEDLDFCSAENEAELAELLKKPPDFEKYQYIRDKYCQLPDGFSLIEDLSQILEGTYQ